MLKAGKSLIIWCVENRIDTIVIGSNPGWKQGSNMGRRSNQKFVQIPFDDLKRILKYQGERNGIRIVEQEEAYTSKASFIDHDDIPDLDGSKEAVFSGTRTKRGLYRSKEGITINADLNGSANILRKAFPNAAHSDVADLAFLLQRYQIQSRIDIAGYVEIPPMKLYCVDSFPVHAHQRAVHYLLGVFSIYHREHGLVWHEFRVYLDVLFPVVP